MNDKKLNLLQRIGEDTAYTFKGLYKESDWLELKYKLYLLIPIIFSIVSLGFDQEIPAIYLKILAVSSLVFTVFVLVGQKRFESINSYRELADKIKVIYDKSEEYYILEKTDEYENLKEKWDSLREQMVNHPIGFVGRFLSRTKIKREMNLAWLGSEYEN